MMKTIPFLLLAGFLIPGIFFHLPEESAHSAFKARASSKPPILVGADRMNLYLPLLKNKRVALLVNQTSRVGSANLVDSLLKLGVQIQRVFSPEHGFRGLADAGAKIGNTLDSKTGLTVISLYGTHKRPSDAQLKNVDLMIYDLQDVGVRFYTYISSLQEWMEAAAQNHIPVIVLDRPDPNGNYIDGPVLENKYRSFVGKQAIPIVYGMTSGEYARMLNGEGWLEHQGSCSLTVIPCKNYTHCTPYTLPVPPSPNLPNMRAVHLYPSLCLFEGTVFSVGRGTKKAFQVFGHPSLPHNLYSFIPHSMVGASSPPFQNEICYGFDLSKNTVGNQQDKTGRVRLKWLLQAYQLFPEKNKFFTPYFDLLAGNDALKEEIRAGWSAEKIRSSWNLALKKFKKIRKKYLLYP
ncbi:MAG: exo-beta-N-acetylmuramidase NamZ family protein [Chitinophagaceae bacterium]